MTSVVSRPLYSSNYSSESNRRKTVGLTIRQDLLATARENSINLSQLLENTLIDVIQPQTQVFSLSGGSLFGKREIPSGSGSIVRSSIVASRARTFLPKKLHQEDGPILKWRDVRSDFLVYMKSIEYNERTVKRIVSSLDKHVVEIQQPFDIVELFSKVQRSKRHLILGLRKLFSFYQTLGCEKAYLDTLRAALPKVQCGIDLKIPSEQRILDSLRELPTAPEKYQALYWLLVDSGLRLVEGVELINSFKDAESLGAFYRCELSMFRGEKQAYYGHFSEHTLKLIPQVKDKLKDQAASNYFRKYGYVNPKYLRKFAFDKMIELEIPESVADFIEGRVPKRIGAKHYMALARQAAKFYPRYARYVERLRMKVS